MLGPPLVLHRFTGSQDYLRRRNVKCYAVTPYWNYFCVVIKLGAGWLLIDAKHVPVFREWYWNTWLPEQWVYITTRDLFSDHPHNLSFRLRRTEDLRRQYFWSLSIARDKREESAHGRSKKKRQVRQARCAWIYIFDWAIANLSRHERFV